MVDKQESYFASGNPQIELKYQLYHNPKKALALACSGGVKIPVGKKEDGFSSEKVDIMGALLLQKEFQTISWIANFILTRNGSLHLSDGIDAKQWRYFFYLANRFSLYNLTSFSLFYNVDFLFAYQYSSAPYKSDDIKFSGYTHLLQFALRYTIKDEKYVDFFFNQNTIPRANEADVTFGFSYHF
jgi:hypothetical protein